MKKAFSMAAIAVVAAGLLCSCGNSNENSSNEEVQIQAPVKTQAEIMDSTNRADIENYMAAHQLTAEPTAEGLYVIVTKEGKGEKVATGKSVKLHYTGKLLNDQVFDSSIPRNQTLDYVVGEMGLIPGWEMAIDGMPEGTELTALFPSALGYGASGTPGGPIPPYAPLRFDIKIVSVK